MANPPVSMSLRPRLGGLPDIEADNADKEGALQAFLARTRGGTPQPSETKGNGTTQFEALGAARARQGPVAAAPVDPSDRDNVDYELPAYGGQQPALTLQQQQAELNHIFDQNLQHVL